MPTRRQFITAGAGVLLAEALHPALAQKASELQINSTRYIVSNADTGAIFAQRDARERVAIASLTKVFTAMEAVNIAPLDTQITTTEDDMQSAEATTMGFGPGETFSLEELIYGMLLPSGNDAAWAVARVLGSRDGDSAEEGVERFMAAMNERVQLMGLKDTNLVNPDGWGVPDHYSSAADVAAFMAYASTNQFLLDVLGTARYTTSSGYTLTNTNKVLSSSPSVIGGKTGYDLDSGWCLVQIAQRQNTRMIAVTLDGIAPDDWYDDNLSLLDYGFEQQLALGSQPFDGEFVTWADPAPLIFAQAGSGEAVITGQSEGGEQIVAREETVVPDRIAQSQPVFSFAGHKSSTILAGVAGTAMAAAMAIGRWADFGGDRTMASIGPSLSAMTGSMRRAIPVVARHPRDVEHPEPVVEERSLASDAPGPAVLPDIDDDIPTDESLAEPSALKR